MTADHARFAALEGSGAKFDDDAAVLARLQAEAAIPGDRHAAISARAAVLVETVRRSSSPTLMEHVLAEYGLSSPEGVALMGLAEALLRVPDAASRDALIRDRIARSDWRAHLGRSPSRLVNTATRGLSLAASVLALGAGNPVRQLGAPVIRAASARAMREMGRQFVLGVRIDRALAAARKLEAKGYSYSYDMLGEAAMTAADALRYAQAYENAITEIGKVAVHGGPQQNPGISIKLSALHPRYEEAQSARVMAELVPVVLRLALMARSAGIQIQVDAEEQARLVLSLEVIDRVLADPGLAGWDGFGVVVQAYGKRAGAVIDALHDMAGRHRQRLNIRLVKGAYWDTEMKLAQVEGMPDFPLFTSKTATDVSYICLAAKLFGLSDRLFPQFATHNAHTVAAVLELAQGRPFELQRLHGMGERLHELVRSETGRGSRIYAPVGPHRDLLAYLVRRLLENGANSSFVNQITDTAIPAALIAADPFAALAEALPPAGLVPPAQIFGPGRQASAGLDLSDRSTVDHVLAARRSALGVPGLLAAGPILADGAPAHGAPRPIADASDGGPLGQVCEAEPADVSRALDLARIWDAPAPARAGVLLRAAALFEDHADQIFALLTHEAGKTLPDALGELREACDFLRYYAAEGAGSVRAPRGIITAISPWNFPLAIFTGQIAAALMAGNAVLAKPADQTPLVAALAVRLMHEAGVPRAALQLLPGPGATVGAALSADPRVAGVVFTGSTATARRIAHTMAAHLAPGTPLIAETGGINAMVVDSTALHEQAVRDIVASAFRSAGQRCSALRCLYVQEDVAAPLIHMLKGAMDLLVTGDPADPATDVGPVIDAPARDGILRHIDAMRGNLLHRSPGGDSGLTVAPTLLRVDGIAAIEREVFGPVLHLATFRAQDLDAVLQDINASGYGLTFGLHSRIEDRIAGIARKVHAGNIYVNRNQIGAVVGSQPFGGEGLSGTGPKAGGPLYLPMFHLPEPAGTAPGTQAAAGTLVMPGPTGESNRLELSPRAPLICLGPGPQVEAAQMAAVRATGGEAIAAGGDLAPDDLPAGISGALWWGDADRGRDYARALAERDGPVLRLVTALPERAQVLAERHLCIDTTAAGGNVALMAQGRARG